MNLEAKKMRSIISEKSKKFQKLFLYENRVGKHYTLYFTPIVVCQKGIYFAASSQAEPGRSPRPRRSLFFCLIARADGAQLFVGGSESRASTRKSRSGLSFFCGFARAAFACRGRCGGKGRKSGRGLLKSRAVWAILETGRSWAGLIQEAKTNAEICTVDENA